MTQPSHLDRGGVALGVSAYLLWGVFPAFFHLLASTSPVEVLAHRVLWTLVLMAVLLCVLRGWGALRSLPLRVWAMVTAASALIAVNWVCSSTPRPSGTWWRSPSATTSGRSSA